MSSDARRTPRVIPVIDVMGGQVVRAVGGRRHDYQPIRTPLAVGSNPVEVARGLLATTSAADLYVADLDAIREGRGPSRGVLDVLEAAFVSRRGGADDGVRAPLPRVASLPGAGKSCRFPGENRKDAKSATSCATTPPGGRVTVWVDIGIGADPRNDVRGLPDLPHVCPVVGFETARVRENLLDTIRSSRDRRVGLSIDLRDGDLIGSWDGWGLRDARDYLGLAHQAVDCGVRTLFVIDLGRVGQAEGPGTEGVCRELRVTFPNTELIAGGGIRGWDDIDRLGAIGVDGVLVSSAVHTGGLRFPRPAS